MSVERYSNLKPSINHGLHIDEASMITLVQFYYLISQKADNLYLYGDTMQIGVTDFLKSEGYTSTKSILDLKFKKHHLMTVHRYGGDLGRMVK